MTAEEIERTLQRVAVAIEQLTQAAVRADERQDSADSAQHNADERLNALIDAQVGHEGRQARLEEAMVSLVQLARIQEERIDGQDESRIHTDARLDALIDAQIAFGQRVEQLTTNIERAAEHFERMAERVESHDQQFGRIEALQSESATHIKALIEAQARTDEQIRSLLDHNGSGAAPKAGAKSAKKAMKKTSKKRGRGGNDQYCPLHHTV